VFGVRLTPAGAEVAHEPPGELDAVLVTTTDALLAAFGGDDLAGLVATGAIIGDPEIVRLLVANVRVPASANQSATATSHLGETSGRPPEALRKVTQHRVRLGSPCLVDAGVRRRPRSRAAICRDPRVTFSGDHPGHPSAARRKVECGGSGPGCSQDDNWNEQSAESPNHHQSGFFDLTRADNPFAGYSIIYASSCTGDAYLGNVAQKISPTLTVQHRGLVDGTAVLDYLAAHYPNATQVVVIGKTAGSIAAPLYGGLVTDRLPHATVTVFGAQSGAWPNNPDFNATVLDQAWGAYHAVPAWAINGLTVRDWGIPQFWVQAAHHAPRLVLSRFDYAFDPHAASEVTEWMPGHPPNLLAIIDANEAEIESARVTLHSYTAPGANHEIFEGGDFLDLKVNNARLVDWLKQLVTGKPPSDVHCDQCDPPTAPTTK